MLLKLGSRGTAVAQAQRWLGIHDDGIFGQVTQDVVRAFQQTHHLSDDGVIGDLTWRALQPAQAAGDFIDMAPAFPTGNYGPRTGAPPSLVILHHSDTTSADNTLRVLKAKGYSTHFEVERDGTVRRYLDPSVATAWQCRGGVNGRSIGIDVTHHGDQDFPAAQVQAVARLLRSLSIQYGFPLQAPPDGWKADRDQHDRVILAPGCGVYRHRNLNSTICPADFPLEQALAIARGEA